MAGLDELDFKIIMLLQENGRRSNAEIAKKVGVSEATARRRVINLVKKEVIKITAMPDPKKIGINAVATLGIVVEMGKLDPVAKALSERKDVHFVAITTGRYDIIVWVMFPTTEELSHFLKYELPTITGIIRSETLVNLEIKKRTLGWVFK